MTNAEAISALLYPYDVDTTLIEKACIDEGISAQGVYDKDAGGSIAKAAIAVLKQLLVLVSESNGGYSLSYNIEGLKERIYSLSKQYGYTEIAEEYITKSRITDCTNRW